MLLSQRAYARHRHCSQPFVSRLVKAGRIPLTRGKINPALADAALAAASRARVSVSRRAVTPELTAYMRAKTFYETFRAQREKLEYETLMGRLLERDRVLEVTELAFENVRRRFRGLAKSLAPLLAQCGGRPSEIERILVEAIDTALADLADDVLKPQGAPFSENRN